MKMSESFSMPIRGEYERDYCDEYHYTIYDNCGDILLPCLPEDVNHEAIVEAVNNHDALTERVKELEEAIEAAMRISDLWLPKGSFADNPPENYGELEALSLMARKFESALEKNNG